MKTGSDRYVLDASVLAQYVLPDEQNAVLEALLERLGVDLALYVPEYVMIECANVHLMNSLAGGPFSLLTLSEIAGSTTPARN
ncbi:MAG TPA: hypothetical protein VGM23_05515 [Armatimonadota bacterium]|jgi:predicted nucleic acid-binding protein